jgi:CBS domain-containing membrane protein
MQVKDLMTTSLHTVHEHDTLLRARELMLAHHVRHLPVIDGASRFVGLLTQRDMLEAAPPPDAALDAGERDTLEATATVGSVMRDDVIAVDQETDLAEAGQYLLDHKFGCLPVLHDGHLTGIVTEADFVELAIRLLAHEEA